jgi:hypothetical protein
MQSLDINFRLDTINKERYREIQTVSRNPQNLAAIQNLHNQLNIAIQGLNFERIVPGDAAARNALTQAEQAAERAEQVNDIAGTNPIAYSMFGPRFRLDQNQGWQQQVNTGNALGFFTWFQDRINHFMIHDPSLDIRLMLNRQTRQEDVARGPYETRRFTVDSFTAHEFLKYINGEGGYSKERQSSLENIFANVFFTRFDPKVVGEKQSGTFVGNLINIANQFGNMRIRAEAATARLAQQGNALAAGEKQGFGLFVQISQMLQDSMQAVYKETWQRSRVNEQLAIFERYMSSIPVAKPGEQSGLFHNYSDAARKSIARSLFI